jgi:hypothetical protein
VTGDQLLTNSALEAADMGYGEAELLGYLNGPASIEQRPEVPWASRFGQVARA